MKMIKEIVDNLPSEGYAVFDFDNTCIINDIQEALLAYLCENSILKNFNGEEVFKKYYQLIESSKLHEAYEFAVSVFWGFSLDELRKFTKDSIDSEGSRITKRELFGININKGIKRNESIYKLMKLMYIKGYKIYIVSTSSKYVVEWAFKRFFSNISANVIGIENIIKNRILTDELVYPLSVYGGKVENIKNKISGNEKPILAVGDSIGDEKMLEYSQVKIVVDRNNQLTKIAKDKGWIVLLQR